MSESRYGSQWFDLTPEQREADERFAEELRKEYIEPLIEEMENLHLGYSQLSAQERFWLFAQLNQEYVGKGDCLPVICPEFEAQWFQAYAGIRTGLDEHFLGKNMGGPLPMQTSEIATHPSLKGERHIIQSTLFTTLPPAFRIAVLGSLVRQVAVVGSTEAFRFAMCGGELRSYRVAIEPKITFRDRQQPGSIDGWTIHLRDVRPKNEEMIIIAKFLRSYLERVEETGVDIQRPFETRVTEEPDHRSKRRAGNETTQTMVRLVDACISNGVDPRRGGNSSWAEVWRVVTEQSETVLAKYLTPEAMSQSYSQYKRREKQRKRAE